MEVSRRKAALGIGLAVAGTSSVGAASRARTPTALPSYLSGDALMAAIEHYVGLGIHRTASSANMQAMAWMSEHLAGIGFRVDDVTFDLPYFEPGNSSVQFEGASLLMLPQWPIAGPVQLTGALADVTTQGPMTGAIGVATLPYNKRSSIDLPLYQTILHDAKSRGAVALIALTEGPTGEIISMNAPLELGPLPLPVGLVSPRTAASLLAAAKSNKPATFVLDGSGPNTRKASNLLGVLDRPGDTIVVSTPMSGWTPAGGERGPGIAIWRALARWASLQGKSRYVFIATSGHEFGHLGFQAALPAIRALVPQGNCKLWLHLGANIAVHGINSQRAASGRYLAGSLSTLPGLAARFAGVAGLWPPVPANRNLAAGELKSVLEAGFAPAIGIFGAGPLHHTQADTAQATTPELLADVALPLLQTLVAWGGA